MSDRRPDVCFAPSSGLMGCGDDGTARRRRLFPKGSRGPLRQAAGRSRGRARKIGRGLSPDTRADAADVENATLSRRGATPNYADYIVFGAFQWARVVSPFKLLADGDPVYAWRERLLDAFDGMARKSAGLSGVGVPLVISRTLRRCFRHARACPGHPRLSYFVEPKTWMAGTSPAMTWRGRCLLD
jgi:hypothetical protein